MKFLALALAVLSFGASAQPRDWDHGPRHWEERRIPDRVEQRNVFRDGRRVVITKTYRCMAQRHGQCTSWVLVDRDRDVVRRR